MVQLVCGYTIFYQTDNNVLPPIEQLQVKLKSEVAYHGSVLGPLLFLFLISDMNNEITDSGGSWFADDTRILLGIKDEEDRLMLQNDIHKLYKLADTNNMKFNANKFEILRYGKEH